MSFTPILIVMGVALAAALWAGSRATTAARSRPPSSPQGGLSDADSARRLARAIASDVALYHADECAQARDTGVVPAALAEAIAEGRTLFEARVGPPLFRLYDTAIDELVTGTPRR